MSYVVDLGAPGSFEVPAVGGKAANLSRMIQAALPVPAGFAVTAEAYRKFIEATELAPVLFAAGAERSEDLLADLERTGWSRKEVFEKAQEHLLGSPIPEDVAREVREAYRRQGGGPVAVRSSATDEDSLSFSFAGQYDTFLDVEGEDRVLDALRRCWASVWSYRSYVYRRREDPDLGDVGIAAVVQRMVPAEVSGVLFTVDPVAGRPEQMTLEASWGLGEGIVGGQVTTDTFLVDRDSLAVRERVVRYKLHRAQRGADGRPEIVLVPQELREAPSLSDAEAVELSRLALRAREIFGGEQDVEWAREGGRFHLLQSRPVTTQAPEKGRIRLDPEETDQPVEAGTMWSMMDTGEAVCGIMTPFSETFMKYYQYEIHGKCLRRSGALDIGVPHRYTGYLYGRCYLNVSYLAHLFAQCPPLRDQYVLASRFASEEIDFPSYRTPFPGAPTGLARLKATLFWFSKQFRYLFMGTARKKALARRNATYDAWVDRDLTKLTMQELGREIQKAQDAVLESGLYYFPWYFMAFGAYDNLSKLCRKILPGQGFENKLKAEASEFRTIDVTEDLWKMADAARKSPAASRILRQTPAERVPAELQATPEGKEFWEREVEPLLKKHGVRGKPPEMEFMNRRWIDDPALLFRMARTYLEHDFRVDEILNKGEKARSEITRSTLEGLPFFKRKLLSIAIGMYYRFAAMREATRMWPITETWVLQRLVHEVGRRLVEKRILRTPDELAFVDFRDVLAYAKGLKGPEAFDRRTVERNRQAHIVNHRVPDPPLTLIGPYDPASRAPCPDGGPVLEGLGTSPGRVSGKARLVEDPASQADEFRPGEVLVAHFTNATWTPLFVTASAVVTDLGSVLAHSSIVAREFGIPAVVNTRFATRRIKTGDTVVVDGDAGKVYLEA